jgi:hypothetical protein
MLEGENIMSERLDAQSEWPLRPWIMAAVCAVAGLIFDWLTDWTRQGALSPERQAAATFVAIATVAFVLTVELRRWQWALAFALGWGAVIALVGWFTASYNSQGEIFEWPFLSGIFAVLIAAPLFQTVRDEGVWRFPYERLHGHAWMDAVIGAASLFFTGISFLLAWLIAGLFDLIGIDFLKDLLQESWFGWMLAGFAFGAAVGLLRERDALLTTLQRLVMVVFSVLAPVLAAALVLFLLSLPFTGLDGLWNSDIPATPLLLLAGAGAVLLTNAVIGNGKAERSPSNVLQWASLALALTVLPLAIIAGLSIGERIGQYGWTPERIWGVIAIAVAIAYGAAAWWSVWRARRDFDDVLRPLQIRMAIGLCGLALFLALPIVDFGAISAGSQMARFNAGKVSAGEFDWRAMAFDFGPGGRRRLQEIARTGPPIQRDLAKAALASESRYSVEQETRTVTQKARVEQYLRVLSPGIVVDEALKARIAGSNGCSERPCALVRIDADRLLLIYNDDGSSTETREINLPTVAERGGTPSAAEQAAAVENAMEAGAPDLSRAEIEIRAVERKQVYVDGFPVGDTFE